MNYVKCYLKIGMFEALATLANTNVNLTLVLKDRHFKSREKTVEKIKIFLNVLMNSEEFF